MPISVPSSRDWLLEQAVSYTFGGKDGVVRGYGSAGAVTEQGTPSLQVDVGSLGVWISNQWYTFPASESGSGEIADPGGGGAGDLRRIDLIVWTAGTGVVVVTGVAGAGPSIPSTPSSSVLLAHIYCRSGMSTILDTDDASNGYIVDARDYH